MLLASSLMESSPWRSSGISASSSYGVNESEKFADGSENATSDENGTIICVGLSSKERLTPNSRSFTERLLNSC
jgi:hypothetical protein